MAKIVWTPENSLMGLGTVVLERPLKPLTLQEYRSALSNRIDRMVEQEDPEEAAAILSATVERYEPLSVSGHLANAGNVLAEDSEWLGQRSGMFSEKWPVPPSKIKPDPELTPEDLDERGLEEFLGMLYHDR